MEWVETTAKTVDEAISLALDQLGVDRDEVEVEVLDEPKSGLFGRMRSEARVRARVQPTTPSPKEERRERKTAPNARRRSNAGGTPANSGGTPGVPTTPTNSHASPPQNSTVSSASSSGRYGDREQLDSVPAAIDESGREFLAGLLTAMGLDATIECSVVNGNMIEFRVVGRDLGVLIGPKAQTLQAAQELLRTVIHYNTSSNSGRILLDVAGYREKRRAALVVFTSGVAADVVASGERRALEAMSPADRKVIHDAVNDLAGVRSMSEGEEPTRYVVLLPA
jgi:spoIIIJ-associated protein